MKRGLRDLASGPAVTLYGATALLLLSHYQGSTGWFSAHLGSHFTQYASRDALPYFWWFLMSLVLYMGVPLAFAGATRARFVRGYGLGWGERRVGLAWALMLLAVMIPAAYFASKTHWFKGAYPLAGEAAFTMKPPGGTAYRSAKLFFLYEAAYCGYFVSWEFFFRGWMLNALLPRVGRLALVVQMIPFALMHMGKPEPEAFGSIVAGIALGLLSLRTRSFWYGALVHCAVAVFMDVVSR